MECVVGTTCPSHDHRALLILDSYKPHKATEVLNNLDVSYIPGGCTPLVQPMDVSVNKPFKGYIKEQWTQWMAAADTRDKTPRGNLKALTRQDVISLVATAWNLIQPDIVERSFLRCGIAISLVIIAWNLIQPDIVERSFLRCGIANALDGSEDEEFSTWLKEAQTLYGAEDPEDEIDLEPDEDFDGFSGFDN